MNYWKPLSKKNTEQILKILQNKNINSTKCYAEVYDLLADKNRENSSDIDYFYIVDVKGQLVEKGDWIFQTDHFNLWKDRGLEEEYWCFSEPNKEKPGYFFLHGEGGMIDTFLSRPQMIQMMKNYLLTFNQSKDIQKESQEKIENTTTQKQENKKTIKFQLLNLKDSDSLLNILENKAKTVEECYNEIFSYFEIQKNKNKKICFIDKNGILSEPNGFICPIGSFNNWKKEGLKEEHWTFSKLRQNDEVFYGDPDVLLFDRDSFIKLMKNHILAIQEKKQNHKIRITR